MKRCCKCIWKKGLIDENTLCDACNGTGMIEVKPKAKPKKAKKKVVKKILKKVKSLIKK